MQRTILIALLLGSLIVTTALFGAEQTDLHKTHEMLMKGGQMRDTRTELKLDEQMKVLQKTMMREHLSTLGEIIAALGANDLNRAAEIAKTKLGWNQAQDQNCSMMSGGEKDFLTLGKAMHMKADEFSGAAKAGKREAALVTLSELINSCNACHDKFRH